MDFTSWDRALRPDELAHFGTKGMKWGQRRFQNPDGSLTPLGQKRYGQGGERSSFGRSRDLNKLDREYVRAEAKAKYYKDRAETRYSRKNYRFKKHNPNMGDLAKDEKTKKFEKKARDYKKLANKSKSMSDRIINNSLKKGMSVRSKDVLREVNIGRNFAKSVGISMLLPNGVYTKSTYAKGSRYKVVNDGNHQRIHKKRRGVSQNVGHHSTYVFA